MPEGNPVNDEHRAVIRHLLDQYLPHFEAGEVPSMAPGSYFMRFIAQAEKDKIINDDYVLRLEHLGGWNALTDLDLIGRAGVDDVRALLTAALRSGEHRGSLDDISSVWREYAEAGTFTAILHRLGELEKGD
jgi:hypothetical protein